MSTVCPRCRASLVPRCGCGGVLDFSRHRIGECSVGRDHARTGREPERSCLCGRINVGPDKLTGSVTVEATPTPDYAAEVARPRSERRRAAEH